MFNLDFNKIVSSFEKSGVDEKLKAIDEKIKEKMKEVENTDFSAQSPEAAIAKMNTALEAIADVSEDMLNAATALKEPLIDFQTEFARAMNSPEGQTSIQQLMDKAGINKFKATDITKKISDGLSSGSSKLGGLDFGKVIPKIKIKKEIDYDENGEPVEKLIAIELGKPSNSPVNDSEREPDPPIFEPKVPAQVLKNPFLANNGLIVALGRLPINKFQVPVTTVVQTDPSTGENIVYEAQTDEHGNSVMVPSGFPSNEDFAAKFEQGRNAAVGKMQNAMGSLKQLFGQGSKVFQDSARKLSEASNIAIPPVPSANIKGVRNSKVDPVSGISINIEELAKIEKELDKSLKPKLDQTGAQLELFFNQLGGGGPDNSGADV